jgi:hypothetical protein
MLPPVGPYTDKRAAEFEQVRVAANVAVGAALPGPLLPYQHEFLRRLCIGPRRLYTMDR